MVSRDRTDVSELDQLRGEVRELRAMVTAGFTSITRGSLRVASEDGLIVEGTALVTGLLHVIGRVLVQGLGTLEVSSLIDLSGMLRVLGEILVPEGGKITVGDIRIEGGKIYVGASIVIDGTSGRITAGGLTIDPEEAGGAIGFGGGARLIAADGSPGVRVQSGGAWEAVVGANGVSLKGDIGDAALTLLSDRATLGADRIQISANELVLGVGAMDRSEAVHYLGRRSDGTTGWVSMASGGPTGAGLLRWPFDLSTVSKEFDTTDPSYTPPGHRGIDFAVAGGTPIPAGGSGTVLATGFQEERGYFVILDHGDYDGRNLTTRYYHLIGPSPLTEGAAIAKSAILGAVGSTGLSSGNHLHWETRYDGVAENPRAVMAVYGE